MEPCNVKQNEVTFWLSVFFFIFARFGYETNNSGSRKKLRIKPGSGYTTLLVFEVEPKHLDAARIPIVDPDGSKIFADPSESATRVDNADSFVSDFVNYSELKKIKFKTVFWESK